MFPHFIGIGAEKSGSTWLYHNLKKYRQFWLPPVKEIHYLDEIQRQPSFSILDRFFHSHFHNQNWRRIFKEQIKLNLRQPNLENIRWYAKYLFNPRNDQWYSSLFEQANGRITGDITPEYSSFQSEEVAYVYNIMPKAKIIFLIRNPIKRAWSHALMYERKKGEKFSEQEFIDNFNHRGSRIKTNYLRTIKNWQSYYPSHQFFIGFFEEIQLCPVDLLIRLSEFLGVELSKNEINLRAINRKINSSRTTSKIPENFAVYLARLYYEEIKSLHNYFDVTYTKNWLNYADQLLK